MVFRDQRRKSFPVLLRRHRRRRELLDVVVVASALEARRDEPAGWTGGGLAQGGGQPGVFTRSGAAGAQPVRIPKISRRRRLSTGEIV